VAFDEVINGFPKPLAVLTDLRMSGRMDGGVVPRRHNLPGCAFPCSALLAYWEGEM
jgi:hypothetical protein